MKAIILLGTLATILCSCTNNKFLMDKQATQDYFVCSGACLISSNIRSDETTLAAYQKASDAIGQLIKDGSSLDKEALSNQLDKVLSSLFSKSIVTLVVSDIIDVYSENMINKVSTNEDILVILKSTKAAIDSGIQLALSTNRPVKVTTN